MTKEVHHEIRKLMREDGIWSFTMNTKIYTVIELLEEIGEERFSERLKKLLQENVSRVQCYMDDRILEPLGLSADDNCPTCDSPKGENGECKC